MVEHCRSDPGRPPRKVNGYKLENAGPDREQERERKRDRKPNEYNSAILKIIEELIEIDVLLLSG